MKRKHKLIMVLAGLFLISNLVFNLFIAGCQADTSTPAPTAAPAPTAKPTPAPVPSPESAPQLLSSLEGNVANGEVIFQTLCSSCHGQDAMGNIGPKIVEKIAGEIQNALVSVETMDFIKLNNQEMADVAAYLQQLE